MRFEIRGGGLVAILLSLGILSATVFVLGLLAGYDVGRQSQLDAAQVAASYPLQPPAAAAAAPAVPAATETAANSAQETAVSAPAPPPPITEERASATPREAASAQPPPAALEHSRPQAATSRRRLASATPETASRVPPAATDNGPADETDDSGQDESTAAPQAAAEDANAGPQRTAAEVAPHSHRKPYNIQIEAAMDITGAHEMMARLQKLGYRSHLVSTEIDGQRWYKVEVGPYATEEDASNSEAELRHKYDAAYGGGAHATPPPPMSGGDNADE